MPGLGTLLLMLASTEEAGIRGALPASGMPFARLTLNAARTGRADQGGKHMANEQRRPYEPNDPNRGSSGNVGHPGSGQGRSPDRSRDQGSSSGMGKDRDRDRSGGTRPGDTGSAGPRDRDIERDTND